MVRVHLGPPFRSSSVVEQSAVNRSVVGSSPTCGAIYMGKYSSGSRGAPAKGIDRVSGARVRIPPSPPYIWPLGQAVKTPPFHGGITGSNPVGVIHKKVVHNCVLPFFCSYHSWRKQAGGERLAAAIYPLHSKDHSGNCANS